MSCGISIPFGMLSPSWRQVTHALLTRPPLSFHCFLPKDSAAKFSLDLHVLGTPPAFVLSQDQTLEKFFRKLISSILNTNVFVKFAKTLFGIDKVLQLPCAIVVIDLLLLILLPLFLTVYFSNIIALSRELIYHTTLSLVCQPFFSSFFFFFLHKTFSTF